MTVEGGLTQSREGAKTGCRVPALRERVPGAKPDVICPNIPNSTTFAAHLSEGGDSIMVRNTFIVGIIVILATNLVSLRPVPVC
jgi:hypothetical protein